MTGIVGCCSGLRASVASSRRAVASSAAASALDFWYAGSSGRVLNPGSMRVEALLVRESIRPVERVSTNPVNGVRGGSGLGAPRSLAIRSIGDNGASGRSVGCFFGATVSNASSFCPTVEGFLEGVGRTTAPNPAPTTPATNEASGSRPRAVLACSVVAKAPRVSRTAASCPAFKAAPAAALRATVAPNEPGRATPAMLPKVSIPVIAALRPKDSPESIAVLPVDIGLNGKAANCKGRVETALNTLPPTVCSPSCRISLMRCCLAVSLSSSAENTLSASLVENKEAKAPAGIEMPLSKAPKA